ncbi:hypothetical protein MASR2M64_14600 [Candidatus Cloacimonadota bacterium]
MPQPIQPPTYPAPMVESDMLFNALVDVMVADDIYFARIILRVMLPWLVLMR